MGFFLTLCLKTAPLYFPLYLSSGPDTSGAEIAQNASLKIKNFKYKKST